MLNELLITFTKTTFMNISNEYTFLKIINRTLDLSNKLKCIILNVLLSIIYAIVSQILIKNVEFAIINILEYIVFLMLFIKIINEDISGRNIIILIISISFGFVSLLLSSMIIYIVTRIKIFSWIEGHIIEYLIIGIIQFISIKIFFKIKRFKKGFSFLKKETKQLNIIGSVISTIIIFMFVIYCLERDTNFLSLVFAIIIILIFFMLRWIKYSITAYYKKRMKDRTIENQAEEIKEKDEIIKNLKQELSAVLQINHKYNHRLSAMEQAVNKLNANEEFSSEYADVIDAVKMLSKEYKSELKKATNIVTMPKTNIFSIDTILDYMKIECEKDKINFKVNINYPLNEIIEKFIDKSKLETLLADHIKDAIIAINCCSKNNKEIELNFNKIDNLYQIEILDTGIEFEIETLLKLGLKAVTTHKEIGGSGIGFITTFETIKEAKASLEIEEFENYKYTKAIRIIFDGKNEYRIHSYRLGEIKK